MAEIDYSEFKTVDEVNAELEKRQNALHRLVKHQESLTEDKKQMAASYNEQIKEAKEKIKEVCGVIDGLRAQRKSLE
jgi:predicted transcriptional regulator